MAATASLLRDAEAVLELDRGDGSASLFFSPQAYREYSAAHGNGASAAAASVPPKPHGRGAPRSPVHASVGRDLFDTSLLMAAVVEADELKRVEHATRGTYQDALPHERMGRSRSPGPARAHAKPAAPPRVRSPGPAQLRSPGPAQLPPQASAELLRSLRAHSPGGRSYADVMTESQRRSRSPGPRHDAWAERPRQRSGAGAVPAGTASMGGPHARSMSPGATGYAQREMMRRSIDQWTAAEPVGVHGHARSESPRASYAQRGPARPPAKQLPSAMRSEAAGTRASGSGSGDASGSYVAAPHRQSQDGAAAPDIATLGLDLSALLHQMGSLDVQGLNSLKGYINGYIEGRCKSEPELGQVRCCMCTCKPSVSEHCLWHVRAAAHSSCAVLRYAPPL